MRHTHFTSHGNGPHAIVFVHGWTCDETIWAAQVSGLRARYRVVTLDLPGHGRSAWPTYPEISLEGMARAALAVLDEAGVRIAVWVGHSMGAAVVRQAARLAPERTAGLVLVDGSLYTPERAAARRLVAGQFEGPGGRAARTEIIETLFAPSTTRAIRDAVLRLMLDSPEETATSAFRAMTDPAAWAPGPPLGAPTLAVYPDRATVSENHLRELFENLEIRRVADAGHFLMMERPEEFNHVLEGFLRGLAFPLAS